MLQNGRIVDWARTFTAAATAEFESDPTSTAPRASATMPAQLTELGVTTEEWTAALPLLYERVSLKSRISELCKMIEAENCDNDNSNKNGDDNDDATEAEPSAAQREYTALSEACERNFADIQAKFPVFECIDGCMDWLPPAWSDWVDGLAPQHDLAGALFAAAALRRVLLLRTRGTHCNLAASPPDSALPPRVKESDDAAAIEGYQTTAADIAPYVVECGEDEVEYYD